MENLRATHFKDFNFIIKNSDDIYTPYSWDIVVTHVDADIDLALRIIDFLIEISGYVFISEQDINFDNDIKTFQNIEKFKYASVTELTDADEFSWLEKEILSELKKFLPADSIKSVFVIER